jgi:hypothetical protein
VFLADAVGLPVWPAQEGGQIPESEVGTIPRPPSDERDLHGGMTVPVGQVELLDTRPDAIPAESLVLGGCPLQPPLELVGLEPESPDLPLKELGTLRARE